MTLFIEILRAIILGVLLGYLFKLSKGTLIAKQRGWQYVLIGFCLLFLGSLIDITDEFPELSSLIIIGNTEIEAILEKVVGYSLGSIFVFWGSSKFIPIILKSFNMEKELKKINEVLEEKVKERTKELEKANKVKSEFISIMSHEIRTPLNAISGMSHLLQKSGLKQRQEEYIKKINDSVSQLLYIFNNILNYSDIDSGKTNIKKVTFESYKNLEKLFLFYRDLAAEKRLLFEINTVMGIPQTFYGDEVIITKVIKLVVDNAIKFTEKGYVKVDCEYKRFIDISELSISISDSGIGISEDNNKSITEYFNQVDNSSTRKHGGIGLGLALCSKLIAMLNGTITIKSKLNEGCIVILNIPLESKSKNNIECAFSNKDLIEFNESDNKINAELIEKLKFIKTLLENYDADAISSINYVCEKWEDIVFLKTIKEKTKKYMFDDALEIIDGILKNPKI